MVDQALPLTNDSSATVEDKTIDTAAIRLQAGHVHWRRSRDADERWSDEFRARLDVAMESIRIHTGEPTIDSLIKTVLSKPSWFREYLRKLRSSKVQDWTFLIADETCFLTPEEYIFREMALKQIIKAAHELGVISWDLTLSEHFCLCIDRDCATTTYYPSEGEPDLPHSVRGKRRSSRKRDSNSDSETAA